MVFLRGTPHHPVCLESKKMMDVLCLYPHFMNQVEHFDLNKDLEIEKSLKAYSNFDEIP